MFYQSYQTNFDKFVANNW